MEISVAGHTAHINAERTLWMPHNRTLFCSDIHLGKASHFRKAGIAISGKTGIKDLDRIAFQIRDRNPSRIVFLGDLFHSEYNSEWEAFIDLRNHFSDVEFILVEGNHDIMDKSFYERANVTVLEEGYIEEGMEWRHHPSELGTHFQMAGHIHPGLRLYGKARQSIKLPCFVLEPSRLIFPAFGRLTGAVNYEGPEGTRYLCITDKEIAEFRKNN